MVIARGKRGRAGERGNWVNGGGGRLYSGQWDAEKCVDEALLRVHLKPAWF